MSMAAPQNVYVLVDGVLDKGLSFVASYVESMLTRPVIIADNHGRIHYPEIPGQSMELDDLFIHIPSQMSTREFHYSPADSTLYYRVRYNGASAFVVARQLPPDLVPQALDVLMESKLAIKCYFCKIHKDQGRFEQELAEYLLGSSSANLTDIIKLSGTELDLQRLYYVSVIRMDGATPERERQLIRSYFCECLRKDRLEVIPISWDNCLLVIIPVGDKENSAEENMSQLVNYKDIIEERFDVSLCQGIGRVYALQDISQSFDEARIALTLPGLIGKSHYVKKFSDLGIYYPIFAQRTGAIKDYCLQSLGRLIEYDEKTEGELLPTLRKLLDSNVNMKSTADSLFIHVNTLYYRVNKIQELLNIDFSDMDTRVNLFIAIKVWDTMQANNLFN